MLSLFDESIEHVLLN